MQHRTKRNHELFKFIRSFEERIQSGTLIYLEEAETQKLLDYYEEKGMLDHASKLVEIAIVQNPYRPDYYLLLSRLYYRMDKKETALEVIHTALSYSPMEYDLLYMKARILTEFYEYDEAQNILSQLRLRAHGKQKTLFLLLEAYNYELQRDYENMYRCIKESVIHDPSSQLALKKMWVAVEITKQYKDSLDLHKGILDINPYNHHAWFNLGHAYICMGEYEDAINALEYSFIINPDFDAAYSDCADICIQLKRYPQALEIQLEQLERFGLDSSLLVAISENLIALHRSEEAFDYLNKARILDPYDDEVYYNLARAYANEGDYDMVISQLHEAIKLEERREEYYGLLADAYANNRSYTEANYYYRKATETGPEDSTFWIKHVHFLMGIGEYRAALEVISESDDCTYSNELNCAEVAILYQNESHESGIEALEKYISDDEFDPEPMFAIAPEMREDKIVNSMLRYFQ